MSIILAAAGLMRGRPSWFTRSVRDWRQLVFASWASALAIEIVAVAIGFALNDLELTLRLAVFSPLVYCLVQSFVTDNLYRRADAVSLTLGIVAVLMAVIVTEPLWGLVFLAIMVVAYLVLQSDGLALTLFVAACFASAPSLELLGISLMGGGIVIFATAVIVANRPAMRSLPFVPIVLSSAILSLGFLVGFDIAF